MSRRSSSPRSATATGTRRAARTSRRSASSRPSPGRGRRTRTSPCPRRVRAPRVAGTAAVAAPARSLAAPRERIVRAWISSSASASPPRVRTREARHGRHRGPRQGDVGGAAREGPRAARRAPGAALRRGAARAARRLPGDGRGGQGRHDRARHERPEPPGRARSPRSSSRRSTELAHDWLWRCQVALPARGEIGIFNRSHYEEVVAVRVHPEYLAGQAIDPARGADDGLLEAALRGHRDLGAAPAPLRHARREVLPARLQEEQRERFLDRVAEPEKNWKFSPATSPSARTGTPTRTPSRRRCAATSTDDSPWYVIPADRKWFMRTAVAAILVHHLEDMDPRSRSRDEERTTMDLAVKQLEAE